MGALGIALPSRSLGLTRALERDFRGKLVSNQHGCAVDQVRLVRSLPRRDIETSRHEANESEEQCSVRKAYTEQNKGHEVEKRGQCGGGTRRFKATRAVHTATDGAIGFRNNSLNGHSRQQNIE